MSKLNQKELFKKAYNWYWNSKNLDGINENDYDALFKHMKEKFEGLKDVNIEGILNDRDMPYTTMDDLSKEDIKNIKAYLEDMGGYIGYDDRVEDLMDEFNLDKATAESFVWDKASGLNQL